MTPARMIVALICASMLTGSVSAACPLNPTNRGAVIAGWPMPMGGGRGQPLTGGTALSHLLLRHYAQVRILARKCGHWAFGLPMRALANRICA